MVPVSDRLVFYPIVPDTSAQLSFTHLFAVSISHSLFIRPIRPVGLFRAMVADGYR